MKSRKIMTCVLCAIVCLMLCAMAVSAVEVRPSIELGKRPPQLLGDTDAGILHPEYDLFGLAEKRNQHLTARMVIFNGVFHQV